MTKVFSKKNGHKADKYLQSLQGKGYEFSWYFYADGGEPIYDQGKVIGAIYCLESKPGRPMCEIDVLELTKKVLVSVYMA